MEPCQATSTCGMSVLAVVRSIVMNVAGVAYLAKPTPQTRRESVRFVAIRQNCFREHKQ